MAQCSPLCYSQGSTLMCVCEGVCVLLYLPVYECVGKVCQSQHDITVPTSPSGPTVNDYPQSHCILLMGTVLTTPESQVVWL